MAKMDPVLKKLLKHMLIGVVILFTISFIYTFWRNSNTNSLEKAYFDKVNFSFKGVVDGAFRYNSDSEDGRKLQPGGGAKFNIYYLETLHSSIEDYDPRDSTLEFYCLVKKNRIYIIETTRHENIKGNDIIEFNGKVDSVYHYKTVLRKEKNKYYEDTVLYDQWRPTDIFWNVNRQNVAREALKFVPR
jgi:hypothetical protein